MMNPAISIALVLALATPAVQDAGQPQQRSIEPDGPIATAAQRELRRLALSPQTDSTDKAWSRVRRFEGGREIRITIGDAETVTRYFLSADDSSMTVLNLTHPTLPADAVRALREISSTHPEHLDEAAKGHTVLIGRIKISPTGVFAGDRRVAELGQVVERIARSEVTAITTFQRGRGFWGHAGPLGGYFLGSMAGGLVTGYSCVALAGQNRCDTGAFLVGAMVGGVSGAVYGLRAAARETDVVIYQATARRP